MPVEIVTTETIICDNSACPGNELDSHSRVGWLFINTQAYGEGMEGSGMVIPTSMTEHVFCSPECANTISESLPEPEPLPEP